MAAIPSTLWVQAGNDPNVRYDLFSVRSEQADEVRGSTGTYIDGKDRPSPITGAPVMSLFRSFQNGNTEVLAHRCPGEVLYLAQDADAVATPAAGSYALEIHEVTVNVVTGARSTPTYGIGGRVTDTTAGGLTDGAAKCVPGQKIPVVAVNRALPPNVYGTVVGYFYVLTST